MTTVQPTLFEDMPDSIINPLFNYEAALIDGMGDLPLREHIGHTQLLLIQSDVHSNWDEVKNAILEAIAEHEPDWETSDATWYDVPEVPPHILHKHHLKVTLMYKGGLRIFDTDSPINAS